MVVSQDVKGQVNEYIGRAKRILICLNNRSSLDTHVAAAAFYKYVASQGKSATLVTNGELMLKHKEIFDAYSVDYGNESKPMQYVITIDHSAGGIDKVSYDDKNGKFQLFITPTDGAKPFDFENVSYTEGGGDADLIVIFGVRSLNWLGDLYDERKDLFESTPIVNINNLPGTQEYGTVQIVNQESSISEVVLGLIKDVSSGETETVANLLMIGLMDFVQLLQGNDYRIGSIEKIVELVKMGADIKEAMKKLYYERSFVNFEVIRRVMNNVKLDTEAGLIWSSVSSFDLSQVGVTRDTFSLDGRIIFNICREFRIAFVLYEVKEGEIVVEFESNERDLDVKDLLTGYKVAGNESRAFFTVRDKTLAEVEQEILEMITPKLGVSEVTADSLHDVPPTQPQSEEVEDTVITPDAGTDNGTDGQVVVEVDSESDEGLVTPPPVNPDNTEQ